MESTTPDTTASGIAFIINGSGAGAVMLITFLALTAYMIGREFSQ